jgi:hypothetical protein
MQQPSCISTTRRKQKPRAYQLRLSLLRTRQAIWRRVEVPSGVNLLTLHRIIQASFDWLDMHMFEFQVADRVAELQEEEFLNGEISEDSAYANVTLADVAEVTSSFRYWYDPKDYWEIQIEIERPIPRRDAKAIVVCVDGVGASPPEGCGGPEGFRRERNKLKRDELGTLVNEVAAHDFDQASLNQELGELYLGTGDLKFGFLSR